VDAGRLAVRAPDPLKTYPINLTTAAARKGGGFHLACCLLARQR
jgi:hypothetical protein